MPDTKQQFMNARYIALMKQEDIDNWEDADLILIKSIPCWLNDEYGIAMFEPIIDGGNYTAEDALIVLDALAVHEEYTHGIITDVDRLDELSETYSWDGSGGCLLADLLSEIEKLSLIMNYLYVKNKVRIEITDLEMIVEKDGSPIPMEDNIEKLFTNDVCYIIYKGDKETLWWPFVIEDSGYFLVVIDPALDFDDELEDEDDVDYPLALPYYNDWGKLYRGFDDDYDDDYHYIDKYCEKKGLL